MTEGRGNTSSRRGRRASVAAGIALLLAAAAEPYLARRWTQRIPPGWSWHARFLGVSAMPDPDSGAIPPDRDGVYDRDIQVVDDGQRPRAVVLEDHYRIREPATGRISYEYNYRAAVDPRSGQHLTPEYAGDAFVFPRGVEPATYRLRFSYLKGVPVAFVREETVADLRTYLFAYRGRGEYTESYAGTQAYPGITVQPGQEIRCADDQFMLRVWVEPDTGEILVVDESCYSSDWVYDVATDTPLHPVLRWGGKTAGDDVAQRADRLRLERLVQLALARWLPLGLLAVGGCALAVGIARRGPRRAA